MKKKRILKKAFLAAFPNTIPILAGFLFLGMTYGIYMNVSGFSFLIQNSLSLATTKASAHGTTTENPKKFPSKFPFLISFPVFP